jgi:hypothetical protein
MAAFSAGAIRNAGDYRDVDDVRNLGRLVTASNRVRRIVDPASAPPGTSAATTTAARAGAARPRATRSRSPGSCAARTSSTTAAGSATGLTSTALASAGATAAGASASRTSRGGRPQHRIRRCAKAVVLGSAKRIEDGHNNEGESHDQKGILRGILPGLLSPEPFEHGQHGNTFDKSIPIM